MEFLTIPNPEISRAQFEHVESVGLEVVVLNRITTAPLDDYSH